MIVFPVVRSGPPLWLRCAWLVGVLASCDAVAVQTACAQGLQDKDPLAGDPYVAPGSMLFTDGEGKSGQVVVRAAPYGYYDTGALLSVVATGNSVQNSRAGVNGGYEHGVPAMAADPDYDMVGVYDQVTSIAPRLVLGNVTYDQRHIYPHPALSAAQRAMLRRSMWVATNSVDRRKSTPGRLGELGRIDRYGSTVIGWTADGSAIEVAGWTVPGGGDGTAGQVPAATLDRAGPQVPTAYFGSPTKAFANNWVLEYDPDAVEKAGSQTRRFEGLELDMWNLARRDYEASFHGITIGYTAFNVGADGHHIVPTSDSYDIRLAGNVPRGLVIDNSMGRLIDAGGFVLQPSGSPGTALNSTDVMVDLTGYMDSNRLRLLTYTQRDRAGGGWMTGSVHMGLHVDGETGTLGGARMGELVFNPTGKPGGTALNGASGKGVSIDADGSVQLAGPVHFPVFMFTALPGSGSAGTQVFCKDCLKPGEIRHHGTGMMIFYDGASWVTFSGTRATL